MTAATLLPVGLPLSGLQVYENMRAVDYLETRPEVDKTKIGITGASGGGNQTMYAGAWDKRFKCVVPVCSVGNYQAYLQTACCMCEVVPGALKFTEEWAVLALTAPRALMVMNATKDGVQFSVDEARKSLAQTYPVYNLYRKPGQLEHAIFDSKHDYNKEMREAMYGFMTLHLKGEGKGEPIQEPEFATEKPEDLRCYPGDTRPKDFITIPKFAEQEAKKLLAAKSVPKTITEWTKESDRLRNALSEKTLSSDPKGKPESHRSSFSPNIFFPEPGARADYDGFTAKDALARTTPATRLVVLVELDNSTSINTLTKSLEENNNFVGIVASSSERGWIWSRVGRAPDHNPAEWGLWVGCPLLEQWVTDVRRLLDYRSEHGGLPRDVIVVGEGPAGLVALVPRQPTSESRKLRPSTPSPVS